MKPVIEFKGSNFTLMVLHLFDTDTEQIAEQLADKVSKSPLFFQNAPIVIDLQATKSYNNSVLLCINRSGLTYLEHGKGRFLGGYQPLHFS